MWINTNNMEEKQITIMEFILKETENIPLEKVIEMVSSVLETMKKVHLSKKVLFP
jgi:hypothetical protein